MLKTLMGTAVSAAVLFGAMALQPKQAQAIVCGNCASEVTQILNWVILGLQYTEDQAQTAEMIRQGVELYNQGEQMRRMLERGNAEALIGAATSIGGLMGVQGSAGGETIYWDDAPGAVAYQESIFPEELPRDPLAILAYKQLQHAAVRGASLNARAVAVQAMRDIEDMQRREADLEREAGACQGQTCVLDIQRQRSILAQEMAVRHTVVQASQAEAQQAVKNYEMAAKERAEANWDIDMAGMPGAKTGKPTGLLSSQGRSTTGATSSLPTLISGD